MAAADPSWRIMTPAQLQLVGPSQCGKSTFLKKLLGPDGADVFDINFKQIWYASPGADTVDAAYVNELREVCDKAGKSLRTSADLPTVGRVKGAYPQDDVLVVLDDVTCFKKSDSLSSLSSYGAHHCGLTVVYCLQNPFQQSRNVDLITVSRNLTGRFIFWQLADWAQYGLINQRVFPDRRNFLAECLAESKERGLNYVFVNIHPRSKLPRRYMCYTGLLVSERAQFSTAGKSPLFFDLDGVEGEAPAPASSSSSS